MNLPPVNSAPAAFRSTLTNSGGLMIVLFLLVMAFGTLNERFLSPETLQSVINQIPAMTFVSVGMTFVLISGGIDLSVGSVLALTSSLAGVLMSQYHWNVWFAALLATGLGGLLGTVNGFVTVFGSIPSFIVTLGMLQIARGFAYLISGSRMQFVGAAIEPLAAKMPGTGVSPAFAAALLFVVAGQFLLTRTVFGRYCIAIGTNEKAVRMSGIDPRPTRIRIFVLCGVCAGIAGIIETSRLSTADPNGAKGFELLAIAAAVIGGTSLSGGRGSVISTFFGVLIVAVLQTGLAHAGAREGTKYVITGTVTIVAVAFDAWRGRWTSLVRTGWRRVLTAKNPGADN